MRVFPAASQNTLMKHITFYLDFISPFAWLAFDRLPQVLHGTPVSVSYQPILFAGLLKHYGQLGPAEIPGKREWTYRQVVWLARQHGVALEMPAKHPFNPLALLRLALACAPAGQASHAVCETLFRHVWQGGLDAADPQRLQALTTQMAPARDPAGEEVKAQVRANTNAAIAAGVFGVPSFAVDDKLFWGFDALPMLHAYLLGERWFASDWDKAGAVGR